MVSFSIAVQGMCLWLGESSHVLPGLREVVDEDQVTNLIPLVATYMLNDDTLELSVHVLSNPSLGCYISSLPPPIYHLNSQTFAGRTRSGLHS